MSRPVCVLAAAVLALLASGCERESTSSDNTVQSQPTKDDSEERTKAALNRVAGAFYSSFVPKLKACWGSVKGTGMVLFQYTYRREENNWVFQKIDAEGSSLEKGQETVAMNCMQDAVRGSTFPIELQEVSRGSKEMVIHWGWPVPLPTDTTQLARMVTTGGGGGKECKPNCHDCVYDQGTHKSFCKMTCSGYSGCVEDGSGTGCRMTLPYCSSGWSGSWTGSGIIAR